MNFSVRHSLPGRIRIRYNKNELSKRQAALAVSLLSVQEGMTRVSVNYTTPAERAAVTEIRPSLLTPGGYPAGAVAPRCPRRAKNLSAERSSLLKTHP